MQIILGVFTVLCWVSFHIYFFHLENISSMTPLLTFDLAFISAIGTFYYINKRQEISLHLLQRKCERLELGAIDDSRQATILQTINEIIEIFGGEADLKAVLNRIVEAVKRLLSVDVLILQLYSDEERKFFMRIVEGRDEIDLGEALETETIERKKSFLINNLNSFPEYKNLTEQGFHSMILAPLRKREKSIGIIGAFSDSPRYFSDSELRVITAIAYQAGLIVENATLLEKTKLLSITDGLTSLYNRRHFQRKLDEELKKMRNAKSPLSLLLTDIDFFKNYNDINGHPAGDEVLRKVANIMKENTKGSDIVARYGGEEFVVILPRTSKDNATKVAEHLRGSIQEYNFKNETAQPNKDLTITIGLASFPEDAKDAEGLIQKADEALYEGKRKGRNQVRIA